MSGLDVCFTLPLTWCLLFYLSIYFLDPRTKLTPKNVSLKDAWCLAAVDGIYEDSEGHHWLACRDLITFAVAQSLNTLEGIPKSAIDPGEVIVSNDRFVLDYERVMGTPLRHPYLTLPACLTLPQNL